MNQKEKGADDIRSELVDWNFIYKNKRRENIQKSNTFLCAESANEHIFVCLPSCLAKRKSVELFSR